METSISCLVNASLANIVWERILSTGPDQDCTVVRWCRTCGAIVVDTDFDGRTNPGAILPMRFPAILKISNSH